VSIKACCGKRVRICLVQVDVDLSEPVARRVERVAGMVRSCRGADLVVLPELWPQGGFAYDRWADEAEDLDGPVATAMAAAARDTGAFLHAGSLVERAGDGSLYNTSLVFGPDGTRLVSYRKIHLFGFAEGEAAQLRPGDAVVTCSGPPLTLGLATCYDLRFPEQFRRLVDAGMQMLVVPAAWPYRRLEHWRLLVRARAVESQVFAVACNTAGEHGGVPLRGHSLVVDPWGEVLGEGGAGEDVLTVDIDPGLVERTRDQFPVLRDRRLG
jgi:predicted amidohydrolase